MLKNYYERMFNIWLYGTLASITVLLFSGIVAWTSSGLHDNFGKLFLEISAYSLVVAIFLLSVSLLLIGTEIIYRLIVGESLLSLVKSIQQTIYLRFFLKQHDSFEIPVVANNSKLPSYNPTNKRFNRAVRRCYVNVQKEYISVTIGIPYSQQAQQLLKSMESQIREEVSSYNPDYYFSGGTRRGQQWIFVGNKR
ncbi:MAG: hypothetical protein SOV02_08950 [Streptococcus infantarius]|nr:hypothetical protein [Streptococcus infantarius]